MYKKNPLVFFHWRSAFIIIASNISITQNLGVEVFFFTFNIT